HATGRLHLEPCANRIAIAALLPQPYLQPMTHGLWRGGAAGTYVAPDLGAIPAIDDDRIEQPVGIEIDEEPAATALVVDQSCLGRRLDVPSVGAAEEEVARIEHREIRHVADVALDDEEVAPAIVVGIGKLGVPPRRRMDVAAGKRTVRGDAARE